MSKKPARRPPGPPAISAGAPDLVRRFLSRRSAKTQQTYREGLRDFAAFLSRRFARDFTPAEAVELLMGLEGPPANTLVLDYVIDMETRWRPGSRMGLAPNTVNQRLYTIRALVKLGRTIGAVDWEINVEPSKKRTAYTDVRGPGCDGVRALMESAANRRNEVLAARDRALVCLAYDLGLRRAEAVSLDLEDVDLQEGVVRVMGKREELAFITIPGPTRAVLVEWLEKRGTHPGPLFPSYDRARKGNGRLTGRGADAVIKRLGRPIGLRTSYHKLRHSAITDALDATNGDIAAVQAFSRHKDVRTVQTYDDRRRDRGGAVAELVASRRAGEEADPE